MVLVALGFVLFPLLRRRVSAAARGEAVAASNVAVFKSQRAEIEEDFSRALISAEERDAAIAELSRRLLDEVPEGTSTPSAATSPHTPPVMLVLALALLVPLIAIGLYVKVGSTAGLSPPAPVVVSAGGGGPHSPDASGSPAMSDAKIVEMVDTLAKKMEQNPKDPKGWILLARSQGALGRIPQALAAYERANALQPNDAQILADYADTLVVSQQGRFEGKPQQLIAAALKADPNHLKSLALAGTAELRLGNREASLKHWEKLQSLVAKDSDDYRQVQAIITDVRSGGTGFASASEPQQAPPQPPVATPPAGTATPAKSASGARVVGQVTLAPELMPKLAPNDVLFIFARAKEGPKMPLAVVRVAAPKAGAWPHAFELTDGMAMAPGMTLSAFPEVVIEARISKSGNAQLQPGDLSGQSEVIKSTASGVKVTISKVAP